MKKYFIIITAASFLMSCGGDSEVKRTVAAISSHTAAKSNDISFKVNGENVYTSGWNISRFVLKAGEKEWLNITTNMNKDKRTIMANLDGAVPGRYNLSENNEIGSSHADYKPDYKEDMVKSYSFISGAFIITEVDTIHHKISGIFSGRVRSNHGEVLEITEGKIVNGELKDGVTKY